MCRVEGCVDVPLAGIFADVVRCENGGGKGRKRELRACQVDHVQKLRNFRAQKPPLNELTLRTAEIRSTLSLPLPPSQTLILHPLTLSAALYAMSARYLVRVARPFRALPLSVSRTALTPTLVAIPRTLPTPLSLPTARSFLTTRPTHSKDTTWQSRGVVKYSELKPETSSPSGEITIIDVREPNEVAQGIIPSAVNVPLSQFQSAFSGSGGDFEKQFAFRRPEYDDKIVFYCRSGKRSQQALEHAQKNGWWK